MKKSYEELLNEIHELIFKDVLENFDGYKNYIFHGIQRLNGNAAYSITFRYLSDSLINYLKETYQISLFYIHDELYIINSSKIESIKYDVPYYIKLETDVGRLFEIPDASFEKFINFIKEINPKKIKCDVNGKKKFFQNLPDEDKLWFEIQYPEFTAKMMPIKREKIDKEKIKNSVSGLSEKELKKLKEMIKKGEIWKNLMKSLKKT